MPIRTLASLILLALPLAAPAALATCQTATVDDYPDINYVTACALDQGSFGDGTQTFAHAYLVHVTQAIEADPAFAYSHANADQGSWTYDDGFTQASRQWTDVGAGYWTGARGLVGTGAQADVRQRDQTVPEDEGDACSSVVGHSTCAGASAWFTAQDVASVGVGAYDRQTGTGADCQESYEIDVDAVVVFVPVTGGPQPCAAEVPDLYDGVPFRDLPALP